MSVFDRQKLRHLSDIPNVDKYPIMGVFKTGEKRLLQVVKMEDGSFALTVRLVDLAGWEELPEILRKALTQ